MKIVLGFLLAALAASPALADARVQVVSVYDGDTFTIDTQQGLFSQLPNFKVRVIGVDTPEIRGKCESERQHAVLVTMETRRLIAGSGNVVTLKNMKHDAYGGRIDADVFLRDGRNLADVLIRFGHARPYDGKTKRRGWCGR